MAKIDIRNKKTSVRNEKNERSKKQKSTLVFISNERSKKTKTNVRFSDHRN